MSVPPPIGEGNIFQAIIVMVHKGRMSSNGLTVSFFFSPLLNTFSSLWCRCSEFPLQDQDVHISWHAPCVWWLLPSWNVAGVRKRARDSRSATRSGRRTLAHPSSQRSVCGEVLLTHPGVKFKRGTSWLYLLWGWLLLCSIASSAAVFS